MKGLKTTIVAVISGILSLSVFVMWYLGKIETLELAVGLAAVGVFSNTVGGYFAKDASSSHTFDVNSVGGELPPDDDEQKQE